MGFLVHMFDKIGIIIDHFLATIFRTQGDVASLQAAILAFILVLLQDTVCTCS
jgi:hypothetical protein